MARKIFLSLIVFLLAAGNLEAGQSTITEVEGYSCIGEDKTKKQTRQDALSDAKRKAVENAITYIRSETVINNSELEKDLLEAYSRANVMVVNTTDVGWYREDGAGDCFKVRIKAEVVPDEEAMKGVSANAKDAEGPDMPLKVSLWTDRKEYGKGEKIRIYLKGNKPFYARVVYKDAGGELLQLLPNPYRKENYFNGGVVYEVPSGSDNFDLEVAPPFGEENIVVYASTSPLGEIDLKAQGGVYQVGTRGADVGERTRGVSLIGKSAGGSPAASEFYEGSAAVRTR